MFRRLALAATLLLSPLAMAQSAHADGTGAWCDGPFGNPIPCAISNGTSGGTGGTGGFGHGHGSGGPSPYDYKLIADEMFVDATLFADYYGGLTYVSQYPVQSNCGASNPFVAGTMDSVRVTQVLNKTDGSTLYFYIRCYGSKGGPPPTPVPNPGIATDEASKQITMPTFRIKSPGANSLIGLDMKFETDDQGTKTVTAGDGVGICQVTATVKPETYLWVTDGDNGVSHPSSIASFDLMQGYDSKGIYKALVVEAWHGTYTMTCPGVAGTVTGDMGIRYFASPQTLITISEARSLLH